MFRDQSTPYSSLFQDIYFSSENGIQESAYVYLEGTRLQETIEMIKADGSPLHPVISVGEIGFGVGLNFFLTSQKFLATAHSSQVLHYFSAEKYPVNREDILKLFEKTPEFSAAAEELYRNYPTLVPGFHLLRLAEGRILLWLLLGDAEEMFSRLNTSIQHSIQHWYWDGFSPKNNPDAFSETLFQQIARLSAPKARGASFTAAGWVRRVIEVSGFKIEKREGFGKKRECIVGTFHESRTPQTIPLATPWFSNQNLFLAKNPQKIVVLGAGLSGSAIASALAKRGLQVEVYDGNGIAQRASGNAIGLYNIQISRLPNPISRFAQLGLVYFLRELQTLGIPHHSGIFRSENSPAEYPESFTQKKENGFFFPNCGILSPLVLCEARLRHKNISFFSRSIKSVERKNGTLVLLDEKNAEVTQADHVIYALGADYPNLSHPLLKSFPLKTIRGQVLSLKPTSQSRLLTETWVNQGYITPLSPTLIGATEHYLGATYRAKFKPDDEAPEQVSEDTEALLKDAENKWGLGFTNDDVTSTRVGYRLSTPDKLPIIGPLCNTEWIKEHYQKFFRHSRLPSAPPPLEVCPQEWLLMAMGSRGITYSSYGAEILASLMVGDPLPVEQDLWVHLHSARFFIRNLKKSRDTLKA